MQDSPEYLAKKAFFDKVLTIYGRNAVLEALEDEAVTIHKLHLSKSNKDVPVLEQMKNIAKKREIEVKKVLSACICVNLWLILFLWDTDKGILCRLSPV